MAEKSVIPAKIRHERGRRAMRRIRAGGDLPAVIYGHQVEPVSISIPERQVRTLLRHGAHGLLEIDIEGKAETAVIKEMQFDVFGNDILHVDFARVSKDEKVELEIPIVTRGTAPGISEGGVFEQVLHSISIECPATNIQESVVVNINNLHLGQEVLVKDLKFLEGVKPLVDLDQVVVQVVKPEEEKEEEPGEGGAAEPELIRREKEGEETEE